MAIILMADSIVTEGASLSNLYTFQALSVIIVKILKYISLEFKSIDFDEEPTPLMSDLLWKST